MQGLQHRHCKALKHWRAQRCFANSLCNLAEMTKMIDLQKATLLPDKNINIEQLCQPQVYL